MYIDIHAHAYHEKIAHKVIKQLIEHYQIGAFGNGSAEDLIKAEQNAGIDKAVVLCAATTPSQVIPANNFALDLQVKYPDKLEVFGTIHPDFIEWKEEFARLKAHKVKGLKIHPDFQGFFLNDPKLFPIFEEIGSNFYVMCHIGDKLAPVDNPSCPYKLQELRKKFPKVQFIAAHMGGYLHWDYALDTYIGEEVYIETSSTSKFLPTEKLQELYKKHPIEYILFGSDYPIFDPKEELDLLQSKVKLSSKQIETILTNANRLFA